MQLLGCPNLLVEGGETLLNGGSCVLLFGLETVHRLLDVARLLQLADGALLGRREMRVDAIREGRGSVCVLQSS